MNFEEMIRSEIEDIQVPEKLNPKNILDMLSTANIVQEPKNEIVMTSSTSHRDIVRRLAALAACIALFGGVMAYKDINTEPAVLENETIYMDVHRAESYDEIVDVFSQTYINSDYETENINNENTAYMTESETDVSQLATFSAATVYGNSVYYADGGKICCQNLDTVTEIADFGDKNISAVIPSEDEIFVVCESVDDNILFTLGDNEEDTEYTESDPLISSVSTVFSVKNGEISEIYSQCGQFKSAEYTGNGIRLVTGYDPRGDENTGFGGIVPFYKENNRYSTIGVSDVIITENNNFSGFAVVSDLNETGLNKISAITCNSGKISVCGDMLYTFYTGTKDDTFTTINAFSLESGKAEYVASGTVEGCCINKNYIDYLDGKTRVITRSSTSEGVETNIYLLDEKMNVVNSAGGIDTDSSVSKIKFAGNFAGFYTNINEYAEKVVNLAVSPATEANEFISESTAVMYSFGDEEIFTIGYNDEGKAMVTFFNSNGIKSDEYIIDNIQYESIYTDAVLSDSEAGIVAIPISANGVDQYIFIQK